MLSFLTFLDTIAMALLILAKRLSKTAIKSLSSKDSVIYHNYIHVFT